MKSNYCLVFIILLILSACQPPSSNISTQPAPSSTPQTKLVAVIESPSTTPSSTITPTSKNPSQTPIPPTPTLPPSLSSLRIAFTGEKNIWFWQNGTAVPLTTLDYIEVKISDDGKMIAFRRNGLRVINSDGTNERLLVSADDLSSLEPADSEVSLNQFDWIPGTHMLLFNSSFSGHGISHRDDLLMADADTLEWKTLRDAGEGGVFVISPDGKRVAMVTPHEISLMNINGTNYRSLLKYSQIDTGSEYYYYANPIWALDSQSLMVVIPPRDFLDNKSASLTTVWKLFTNGIPPFQVSQFPAQNRYFISPDFSKISYIHYIEESGAYEIHISNIDGSEDSIYQADTEAVSFTTWFPDSEHFVLSLEKTRQYYIGSTREESIPLTEENSSDYLQVNESYFLYKTLRDGNCELRLGAIGQPSTYLVTLETTNKGCYNFYDFIK